jgi:hypothetical protein
MFTISSNHFSHDQQVVDALDWLRINQIETYCEIRKRFPENIILPDKSGWFDTDAMGVDAEWSSWLADAIEDASEIMWISGEPYVIEDTDSEEDIAEMMEA